MKNNRCFFCKQTFKDESQWFEHLAREHLEETDQLIEVLDELDNVDLFIHLAKRKLSEIKLERWFNS